MNKIARSIVTINMYMMIVFFLGLLTMPAILVWFWHGWKWGLLSSVATIWFLLSVWALSRDNNSLPPQ